MLLSTRGPSCLLSLEVVFLSSFPGSLALWYSLGVSVLAVAAVGSRSCLWSEQNMHQLVLHPSASCLARHSFIFWVLIYYSSTSNILSFCNSHFILYGFVLNFFYTKCQTDSKENQKKTPSSSLTISICISPVYMPFLLQYFRTNHVLVVLHTNTYVVLFVGYPDSSIGKESSCNTGDPSLIPGSGRSTGERIG